MTIFTESEIERFSLDEIKRQGFPYIPDPSITLDAEAAQAMPETDAVSMKA